MRVCNICGAECPDDVLLCRECGGQTTAIDSPKKPQVQSDSGIKSMSRKERKLYEFMIQHNLDSLDQKDVENARLIALGLMGNGLIEWGTIFSGRAEDTAKLSYLSAMVEQNWMIINQLDRLNKKLEKLIPED